MRVYRLLVTLALGIATCCTFYRSSLVAATPEEALQKLNLIRQTVHLNPLALHPALTKAAQNHAAYLEITPQGFHSETKSNPRYTGETPAKRALHAGYEVAKVAENLSLEHPNLSASIEGLMGAIYHRNLFLSVEHDQLGFGFQKTKQSGVYVYNLGNHYLEQLCKENTGRFYRQFYEICADKKRLEYGEYHLSLEKLPKANPLVVFWPAEDSEGTPPAFYHEIPDPLPDLPLSGYPISVQLNPVLLSEPELLSFKLFDGKSGQEITKVRLLSMERDPNKILTAYQFVLFPLERLKWGHDYLVEVDLKTEEKKFELRWQFQTKDTISTLVPVQGKGEIFYLKSGESYSFYFPPRPNQAYVQKFDMESNHQIHVKHQWEDRNTLNLNFTAKPCERVEVFFEPYYSFQVEIREQEALDKKQVKQQNPWCIPSHLQGPAVLDFSKNKNSATILKGMPYYIYLKEDFQEIQLKAPEQMTVNSKKIGPQLLQLLVEGGLGKLIILDQGSEIGILSVVLE